MRMKLEYAAFAVANPIAVASWSARHRGLRVVRRVTGPVLTHSLAGEDTTILEVSCIPPDRMSICRRSTVSSLSGRRTNGKMALARCLFHPGAAPDRIAAALSKHVAAVRKRGLAAPEAGPQRAPLPGGGSTGDAVF
jgi:hypothetical protein